MRQIPRLYRLLKLLTFPSGLLVLYFYYVAIYYDNKKPICSKTSLNYSSSVQTNYEKNNRQSVQLLIESVDPQNHPLLASWLQRIYNACENDFVAYNGSFAVFQNVTLHASKAKTYNSLKNKIRTPYDSDELYKLEKSFMQMQCDTPVRYPADLPAAWWCEPLAEMVKNTEFKPRKVDQPVPPIKNTRLEQRPTLIVQRRENLNLFHTTTDWHNAFLVLVLLRLNVSDVQVLFLDAHVPGLLDHTWATLFNRFERLADLGESVTYSKLIWSIYGYQSLLFDPPTDHDLPLLDEYRRFMLYAHSLHHLVHRDLNCRKLVVTFISRQPYGERRGNALDRMIANEDELVCALHSYFSNSGNNFGLHELRLVRLEQLNFTEQLRIMSQTDVLIGMHGAGLTHTMHLPSKSALIELFQYGMEGSVRVLPLFRRMAKQRSLVYTTWINKDLHLNKPVGTYVPVSILLSLFNETLFKLLDLQ